ncbi:MAG: hypothetical protein JWR84_1175 [Caulobacter sp.]|nr:hypothetical protein [Caulobacter sp.]
MSGHGGESEAHTALLAFAAKYEPHIAAQFLECVERLRARMPGADVLIYDNYQGLVAGFGPPTRVSDAVLSVLALPRHVTLCFLRGAGLDDPDKVLKGGGARVRHVRLTGPEMLADAGIAALIDQALERTPVAIPDSPAGRMVVNSISAKQRPRRPTL